MHCRLVNHGGQSSTTGRNPTTQFGPRDHRVVKVYYSPAELTARLADLGWTASIREASIGPLVGTARPSGSDPSSSQMA
jgi:hypothetical protein